MRDGCWGSGKWPSRRRTLAEASRREPQRLREAATFTPRSSSLSLISSLHKDGQSEQESKKLWHNLMLGRLQVAPQTLWRVGAGIGASAPSFPLLRSPPKHLN